MIRSVGMLSTTRRGDHAVGKEANLRNVKIEQAKVLRAKGRQSHLDLVGGRTCAERISEKKTAI